MSQLNAVTQDLMTRRTCVSRLGLGLTGALVGLPLQSQAAPAILPAATSLPDELEKALKAKEPLIAVSYTHLTLPTKRIV